MLSRVVENIYWMSRYMERTNISLKSLKTCYIAFQDGFPVFSWEQVANQFGIEDASELSNYEILYKLIFDSENDYSFLNNVFRARENARSAQDHINRELWQSLNDLYHLIKSDYLQSQLEIDPIYVFDKLIKETMLYYGVINNSLNRGEAFIFLNIGKLTERGLQIIEMLKTQLKITNYDSIENEDQSWRYLLIALNGYDSFISEYVGVFDPEMVLKQIIYKENYPFSLLYTLKEIDDFSEMMSMEGLNLDNKDLEYIIGKSYAFVRYNTIDTTYANRINFLHQVEANYHDITNVLNINYFGKSS